MKFKTFKITIGIIALLQFSLSSTVENSSTSATELKSKTISAIKNTNNIKSQATLTSTNSNNLKSKVLSKNKNKSNTILKAFKRSSFYRLNGVNPPLLGLDTGEHVVPKEEFPKHINKPKVNDPSMEKGHLTQILQDWQMISSDAFTDKAKFPDIYVKDNKTSYKIKLDDLKFRVNDAHDKDKGAGTNIPHDKNCFWFRLSGLHLYYSNTKSDYNILGAITIEDVVGVISLRGTHHGYHCYIVKDEMGIEWKICSASEEKRNLWVCTIQATLGSKLEHFCPGAEKDKVVVERNVRDNLLILFFKINIK